jgi:predicted nicotinamide N-methyase
MTPPDKRLTSKRLTSELLLAQLQRRFTTINDDVRIGDRSVNLHRPRSSEDLISEADFERDERLPYWAELWPSSTVLAHFILAAHIQPARTIELGCGVGLVSIAAALAGHQVLATDYYEDALLFTRANAFHNLGQEIETDTIDWRSIPPSLPRFDLVLASDVLYESRYADLVACTIDRVLSPNGFCYVADPGRVAAGAFAEACQALGLTIATKTTRPYLAGKIRQTITIYEIARRPNDTHVRP